MTRLIRLFTNIDYADKLVFLSYQHSLASYNHSLLGLQIILYSVFSSQTSIEDKKLECHSNSLEVDRMTYF